jgi:hypothetical protein
VKIFNRKEEELERKIGAMKTELDSQSEKIKRLEKWGQEIEQYYQTGHIVEHEEIQHIGNKGRISWRRYESISDTVCKINGMEYDKSKLGKIVLKAVSEIRYTGDKASNPAYSCLTNLMRSFYTLA